MSQVVADDANYWIMEGIACYMESLKLQNGTVTLGDPEFIRFYWARDRYLKQHYYVPLARLASMGMREFQSQPQQETLLQLQRIVRAGAFLYALPRRRVSRRFGRAPLADL